MDDVHVHSLDYEKEKELKVFLYPLCKHIISRPCTFFRFRKGQGPMVDLHPPCDVSTSFHVHVHSLDYENIRSPVDFYPPCVYTSFHVHVHYLDYEKERSPRWTSFHHEFNTANWI